MRRCPIGLHQILCLLSPIVLFVMIPPTLAAEDTARLTPTEEFVLHEIKAGKEVDLSLRAHKDGRALGEEFVERLVTGEYSNAQIQRRGVRINGAIFKHTLFVSSTVVPFRLWLTSCAFQGGVDFSYTQFLRELSLEGSVFGTSPSQSAANGDLEAFFAGMKVEGSANFSGTVFYIPLDFTDSQIQDYLSFDKVNYEAGQLADFQALRVNGPAYFRGDRFAEKLRLNDAELFDLVIEDLASGSLDLDLNQTHIERNTSVSNIPLSSWTGQFMVTKGEVRLDGVTPSGPVDLTYAHANQAASPYIVATPSYAVAEAAAVRSMAVCSMTQRSSQSAIHGMGIIRRQARPPTRNRQSTSCPLPSQRKRRPPP